MKRSSRIIESLRFIVVADATIVADFTKNSNHLSGKAPGKWTQKEGILQIDSDKIGNGMV